MQSRGCSSVDRYWPEAGSWVDPPAAPITMRALTARHPPSRPPLVHAWAADPIRELPEPAAHTHRGWLAIDPVADAAGPTGSRLEDRSNQRGRSNTLRSVVAGRSRVCAPSTTQAYRSPGTQRALPNAGCFPLAHSDSPDRPATAQRSLAALAAVGLALLPDSRFHTSNARRGPPLPTALAPTTWCWAPRWHWMSGWSNWRSCCARRSQRWSHRNGSGNVMGDPVEALVWLVNELGRAGQTWAAFVPRAPVWRPFRWCQVIALRPTLAAGNDSGWLWRNRLTLPSAPLPDSRRMRAAPGTPQVGFADCLRADARGPVPRCW
jgi:hypothetical protein